MASGLYQALTRTSIPPGTPIPKKGKAEVGKTDMDQVCQAVYMGYYFMYVWLKSCCGSLLTLCLVVVVYGVLFMETDERGTVFDTVRHPFRMN